MRYFFHAEDGRRFCDEEGTEFESEGDARLEAARVLGQLINEDPASAWHRQALRIVVTDSDSARLFTLGIVATIASR